MADAGTKTEDKKTAARDSGVVEIPGEPNKVIIDGIEIEYETDPNAHNRVEPEDRGPGMDEPVHYTYAKPEDKPASRDVRVCDAVKSGDYELVRKLVKEGASVHQRAEQDWTPLNFAAGKGDLKMVELLVEELGADVTAVGRDRRRPLAIAKAASRTEVAQYLTGVEKKLGVWEDPLLLRPYCKAYYLRDLRKFPGWSEKRDNWKINKYWPDDIKADFEKPFEADDVVFVHHDFQVTKSMWRGEHVIFDAGSPAWEKFCKENLKFAIPDDLL
jgi:uncharacterized protein